MTGCIPTRAIGMPALLLAMMEVLLPWGTSANSDEVERSKVVNASNAFALDLFHHMKSESTGNVICSPYSITEALAMTYAGAHGPTREQMAKVLQLPADREPHQGLAELRTSIGQPSVSGLDLRIADRVWLQAGLDVVPSFAGILEASYRSRPGLVDFVRDPEAARRAINDWTTGKTGGQIKDLLTSDDVNPETRLVLTNAISFEGKWKSPFNPKWTKLAPFHAPGGTPVDVPLMMQEGRFRYAKLDVGEILEKTYVDERFAMLILLPREGLEELDRLEHSLNLKALEQWIAQLRPRGVLLSLPKFRGVGRTELSKVLQAMGMQLAFTSDADFSGMTRSERLSLARVIHQAVVEVDEEGTKAYASTAASQEARSLPTMFRVDRPFLFLITDQSTGIILFIGRVTNPLAQKR
jgi:serpin B